MCDFIWNSQWESIFLSFKCLYNVPLVFHTRRLLQHNLHTCHKANFTIDQVKFQLKKNDLKQIKREADRKGPFIRLNGIFHRSTSA